DKISCSGPSLMLDPQTAVHLALVLHELATNARKYGSLSVPSGRLSVTWEMRSNGGCSLLLSWKERDGPGVSAPRTHGFGRALIDQTVRSHGGRASVHYRRDGLTCEIELPLPEQPQAELRPATALPKLPPAPTAHSCLRAALGFARASPSLRFAGCG